MNHMRLWTSAIIIACVVVVSFVLSVPHTRDVLHVPAAPVVAASVPTVALHDTFKKGMHTITGSLMATNACTTVTVSSNVVGNSIHVALLLSTDSGVCLQLPTNVSFKTTIVAPAQLPITSTVNGVAATTTPS